MSTSTHESPVGPGSGTSVVPGAVESAAGTSRLERLNPFPGLFLRAEHLVAMQDYGRDIAHLAGAAGGGGVVHGFTVRLDLGQRPAVLVEPGLAVTTAGEPLRSTEILRIPLDEVEPETDRFWWVEINSTSWATGHEPVAGVLCEDPCRSGGSSGRPRQAQGVVARLRPDILPGLSTKPALQPLTTPRNWLAARLFAAEEKSAGRWVAGSQPGLNGKSWGPVDQTWPDQFPVPTHVVRLGVLVVAEQVDGSSWEVDMWSARRDRGAAPPERDWQWRLGMRPWDVFVAQVLQFQHEVADLRSAQRQPGWIRRSRAATSWASLPAVGLTELPPAVFLPRMSDDPAEIVADLLQLLDVDDDYAPVELEFCWCAPGDLGLRFAGAQHRDRVRLRATEPQHLRVYAPRAYDSQADEPRPVGDWLLLVTADQVDCPEVNVERELLQVRVYIGHYDTADALAQARAAAKQGEADIPGATPQATGISLGQERTGRLPTGGSHGYKEIVKALREGYEEAVVIPVVRPGQALTGVARAGVVRRLAPADSPPPTELDPVESAGPERLVVLIRDTRG